MIISLPWPDPRLTPNSKRRKHWRSYQGVIRDARALAWGITLEAVPVALREALAASDGHIPMTITFYPPDRRHRDDDGMIGAFKHARDGIADALKVDDRRFKPHYVFADPEKPGRVEIELCHTTAC